MKKRIFISVICIGLLIMLAGCRSGKNGESTSPSQAPEEFDIPAELENAGKQAVTVPEKDDYSGSYADMQGTEDIYDELDLVYQGDGLYEVMICIYRVTTLDGIAKADGGILYFEDEVGKVKGEITIQDAGAVFTVTESEFEYINQGDVFEFPQKLK